MAKRALCVGVNEYPLPNMDLKGCANDAKAWARVLVDHYDFARGDVEVLLDADATKAGILTRLERLLAGARRGDVLVFTNSSHGTYVADTSGDEPTYDEALCPHDVRQGPLVDDELRQRFANLAAGVHLTVVSDSCHSGSATRVAFGGPDDRRIRFLPPRRIGLTEIDVRASSPSRGEVYPESSMREVYLSGCRANQYSFDAKFGRRYHGAMTHVALEVLAAADYRITYSALRKRLVQRLAAENFDQEPQLEGRAAAKRRQVFT